MNKETTKIKLNQSNSLFDEIKHTDDFGNEYWSAREMQKALQYAEWRNFLKVINNAKEATRQSNVAIIDHFVESNKMVQTGDSKRQIKDYKLSRYACYLIVQNSDPKKEIVALGQTYFAIQTRKQELTESQYESLSEEDKRFYQRNLTKQGNYTLQQTAAKAGVKNMAEFHNAGYKGLYGGETAEDIFKRKNLRYREDILDNMGEDELIANLFRISQTKQKLINENIKGERESKEAHFKVGKKVRKTIKELGGKMPEELPTPKKSLKVLEKEKKTITSKNTVLISNSKNKGDDLNEQK